jgi:hypothetical protein
MWYVDMMGYYSATKKLDTICMNFKNIMLSEKASCKRTNTIKEPMYMRHPEVKIIKTEIE